MRLVRQNDECGAQRAKRAKSVKPARRGRVVVPAVARGSLALLAVAALTSGCSTPPKSPVAHGAQGGKRQLQAPPARALDSYAEKLRAAHTARVAAAKRWGLKGTPLTAPPPAKKPVITTRKGFEVEDGDDLPPVFTTVPTKDKVVFLTIDDGAEKDPEFLKMMSELKIPYTAFLSNYLVKDDYGYFRTMRDLGAGVNNHTLHHPYLPGLSYEEQRHEICAMQDIMRREFGRRPEMMRPPYGNYNRDTLVAAKSCGVKYAPIWDEEVYVDHWEYREDDRSLHPGDIVLTHFRGTDDWDGTMVDDMRRFLNKVTAEGYAVARLEDYL
ncbi:polysaccharide deacetylase family protein [Streptomyces sp. NBC_00670]|uniref:polysaccharide deacetylase family protein n=1 Tax=Streptomyces sp. NBC_00670 TaxID=2975804 RepID=UPI002E36F8B8|nr:polysaccharide deacetylase family protein [Streptomyces sp. NBC_00670]